MLDTLEKIETFLAKHHLLSLATSVENRAYAASLFYVYDTQNMAFIVASDPKTEHMKQVLNNSAVSGTVALETDVLGKIEGIQFQGEMQKASSESAQLYFYKFPYAVAMQPTLWCITLHKMKLTDNRMGFGKKRYWSRAQA